MGGGRGEGTTYTITEECERLFCDALRAVFLGEGKMAPNGSLVLGTKLQGRSGAAAAAAAVAPAAAAKGRVAVDNWFEIWDYAGGSSFRGFVATRDGGGGNREKTMFVFFERDAIVQDLKPG
jgi:hypothetical protein